MSHELKLPLEIVLKKSYIEKHFLFTNSKVDIDYLT